VVKLRPQSGIRKKENGIMKVNQLKKVGIAALAAGLLMSIGLLATPARSANQDDGSATYKTKCAACHGATAEKKFDATMAQEEMVKVILTGKKMEKPPNMPAYAEKGITEDQAKALVAHMKSLKG
jgi:mono/diheme cytochrome c family protein